MTQADKAARASVLEVKRLWRERATADAAGPALRIGLAASFTVEPLVPFVGGALLAEHVAARFAIAPYNQLLQACLDPASAFDGACDALVLLWRAEDLAGPDVDAFLAGDEAGLARALSTVQALIDAVRGLRQRFPGLIVVGAPPHPVSASASLLDLDNAARLGRLHRRLAAHFVEAIAAIDGVRLVDLDAVQRHVGAAASFDARFWYLYRQPFSDAFLLAAGRQIARIVLAARRAARKCIVLDADNTLWGGIVGEDGIDGIQIGEEFPGSAYRDFQRLLLAWRARGVFLAVASKNDEAEVLEVLDRHDGMVLRREHLSAWQVHWGPKAESVVRIAAALNIDTSSLVFVDDNPMEIDYMRQAHPEIASIQLPADPSEIVPALQALALFDQLDVTDEDRGRADMMRAEQARASLSASLSHESFLQTLDLRMSLFRARPEDLGRLAQLINKTNQFNLTTVRRTLDDVRGLAASPDFRLYGLRVSDRFGDYGLTGVVIVRTAPAERLWTIDTLLLSCRILGRGVEAALLGVLAAEARDEGVESFAATFIPTAKNGLAAPYLASQGFRQQADGTWRLAVREAPAVPAHIEIVGPPSPATPPLAAAAK